MDDKKMMQSNKVSNHNVIMENREKVVITGIIDIHSFDDEVVLVETELGILTIKGIDLKMNKLNVFECSWSHINLLSKWLTHRVQKNCEKMWEQDN